MSFNYYFAERLDLTAQMNFSEAFHFRADRLVDTIICNYLHMSE